MMQMRKFTDLYIDTTKKGTKIPQDRYLSTGRYPIVGQGCQIIAGYWDEIDGIFDEVPAIIFGDHTRAIKYIEEPFFIGADGVKILRPVNEEDNPKYLYYALQAAKIPNLGYSRHFKVVKELEMRIYSREDQDTIVNKIERIDCLIEKRQDELIYLDELVKSRFIEMFGQLPEHFKHDTVELVKIADMLSGGTPSSKHPEYYGDKYPFVTTPCLGKNYIDESDAVNWLSETGVQNSSTHVIPANSVMYGSRVGVGKSSINTCKMCTNQDILSFFNIDTSKYDLLFIKKVMDQYFDYVDSQKRGSTIKGVPSDIVKGIRIPKVPIEEQRTFAEFIQQNDKSKYCRCKSRRLLQRVANI